jgi:AcrR family transcriptional regulator
VPRRSPPERRLAEIAEAATRVFGRLGYRRTHMADVAAAAGLSSGAVYSYVEGKEALFHLVFVHAFDGLDETLERLPLAAPPFEVTVKLLADGLRVEGATPLMRAALAGDAPADVRAELVGIVTERYEMIERIWPVLAVVERCAVDLPELEELYFRRGRPGHMAQLTDYIRRRSASGHLRATPDPAIAARIVTEATTWFAWHRREDRDAAAYEDALVLPTLVAFVSDALVGPE